MNEIEREELQDLLDQRAPVLSFSVVDHLRWHLRAIYSLAISEGAADRNPATSLFTPKCKVGRERRDLNLEAINRMFGVLDLRERLAVRFAIFEGIREYDKLLLVLSEDSVRSSWVQDEVEACLERERRQQRQVLFPIRLDEAVERTRQAWAAAIRRRRHIGDFTRWRDQAAYDEAFQRLLRDLKAPKPNP